MLLKLKIILWIFQLAAFIAASITWNKYKNTTQRYFLFFLGFVLIVEFLGYNIPKIYGIKSQFVYNIFTVISFYFYLYWFNSILNKKLIIKVFAVAFSISIVISIFFEDFMGALWRVPLTTGTFLVLVCSGIFYYNLLNSNDIFRYQKSQKFWIVTGLLIFYIAFLPIQLFQPYLKVSSLSYGIPLTVLNILMYGLIATSFLCLKKD
ncbi:hypothetical protein SAMN05444411_10727 [Lutibacter oricola]|uniref:YhhN-like protein n=1 Tax=Lutibacter oricola TaxID=762486 RepID=A0A1H3D1M4_9FLAO|nr:hypothetical protein [Lutibacter oricola]SDX60291.1 hypothetical protein SAMN05444411_10727 [Lutibacter oricola]